MGRFLTRDTYTGEEDEPESLHLYTYCENDGVNMVDPTGHWGMTDGKYVHQEITKEALKYALKKDFHEYYMITKNHKYYRALLDGSVLPDKKNSSKKKIFGRKIKPSSTFHGKSRMELFALVNWSKTRIRKELCNKKKKFLAIGVVLHSIQDFYAHSYISDLQSYKNKSLKLKIHSTQAERLYHFDWLIYDILNERKNEQAKDIRKKFHTGYKDDPYYDVFRVGSFSMFWVKRDSWKSNSRYNEAVYASAKYLHCVVKMMR